MGNYKNGGKNTAPIAKIGVVLYLANTWNKLVSVL